MNTIDMFRLDNKVALVTGAAGLLGKGFCETLCGAGASVVVTDLDGQVLEKLTHDLRIKGGTALAVAGDVTRKPDVENIINTALTSFGRLDVLVCSAAMDPKVGPDAEQNIGGAFEDYPLDQWRMALDVNLTGLFLCAQAAVKPMIAQGSGSIVFLCSTYGIVGPDQRIYKKAGQSHQMYKPVYYSVTKAGVLGLTRYLSTYLSGTDVRVNALTPGGVQNAQDPEFERQYSARAVLGRMARKDEMNGAILFLASKASSYMTGANLIVDGGWTAW